MAPARVRQPSPCVRRCARWWRGEGAQAAASTRRAQAGARGGCGVWSLCWSGDSQEVVAGTTLPGVVVYDMQRETVKSTSLCHEDDVNAVTFLDAACDVIVSGSDDTNLFVHDRCAPACARTRLCTHPLLAALCPHSAALGRTYEA